MKNFNLLLTTIFLLGIVTISRAGEDDLYPPLRLTDKACDLCGCYLGFQANYNRNVVGLRYRYREFDDNAADLTNPAYTKELFNTFEIYGRYYVTPKIQLMVSIPYAYNKAEGEKFTGIGDILTLVQYKVISPQVGMTSGKIKNTLMIGSGIKFPTGTYNQKLPDGTIEAHYQTGTGSTDFIFSGTYVGVLNNFGLTSDVVYRFGTYNPDNYRFANRINNSSTLFYDIKPMNLMAIIPNFGYYFESAPQDKNSRVAYEDDSGGTVLFLSAGMNLSLKHFSFDASYQKPVYQNLYGSQPQNKMRIIFSAGYML